MAQKELSRRGVFLIGAVLTLIGVGGEVLHGSRLLREWEVGSDWRKVPCVILSSDREMSRRTGKKTRYEPVIEYRYELDGKTYNSRVFTLAPARIHPADINDLLFAYRVGSTQTCFVDPSEPTRAALQSRPSSQYVGLGISTAFLTLGLAVLAMGVLMPRWSAHPR